MKIIEVVAEASSRDTVSAIGEKIEARDFRSGTVDDDGRQFMRLLVADDKVQHALDLLQNVLGVQQGAHIVVLSVEVALPRQNEAESQQEDAAMAIRESLYASVERDTRLGANYVVLVLLSTVVAGIGMIEDNVSAIIGAMVIAPLLGPNLAFGLSTALGDLGLMRKAVGSLLVGVTLAVMASAIVGAFVPHGLLGSHELLARTTTGYDTVALALASGAAAALSLTTGLSSVLVGVMVAVALLPPAAALGLFLGGGDLSSAGGAGLLLAVNIVCVNLASKIVFLLKGVRPRTWVDKARARRATAIYLAMWLATLGVLLLAIYLRRALGG
ncbi:TIGR00341 family protein [Acidihalobacter yilgarnensis]|uniref:TIGR00341 family protein n=1 Tax=Acidihalobacter yilgarnensis TaxID=2819280 RepID=A0A1D8IMB3_9GAMM|nr:TIGR00341 family protein [Acidihalobacter yilgarnensis]AOU97551.1 TIGR00341 family protein [Acidihalobacter yilgarnensis]